MASVVELVKQHVTDLIGQVEIMAREEPERIARRGPRILGGQIVDVREIADEIVVTFDDDTGSAQAHLAGPLTDRFRKAARVSDVCLFEGPLDACPMPDRRQRVNVYAYDFAPVRENAARLAPTG